MTSVKEIRNLISVLPDKDQEYAFKFVDARMFDSLKELVDSDVIKAENKKQSINPDSDEYIVIASKLDALMQLKNCVDEYAHQFDTDEDEEGSVYDMQFSEDDEKDYYDHLYYTYIITKNEIA